MDTLDNANTTTTNPFANSNNPDILAQKEGFVLNLADGFKQNGTEKSPTAEFMGRPANGKRSADEFDDDDDDLGPETDVDAIDDVLLSPSIAAAKSLAEGIVNNNPANMFDPFSDNKEEKATLETDSELQKQQSSEFDPIKSQREETPTPPADSVHDASGLVDNVADSGEDSEDEWNYFKGDTAQKENIPPSQTDKEVCELTKTDLESDTMSQLNPNAAEFVPVSPKRNTASPAYHALVDDSVIAQSPRRLASNDIDISVPNPQEFECEIKSRPSDVRECANGDDSDDSAHKLSSQEIMENFLNGKSIEEIEFQPISTPTKTRKPDEFHFGPNSTPFSTPAKLLDQSEALSTKAVFGDESTASYLEEKGFDSSFAGSDTNESQTFVKEQDPMSMSFYQDKDDDTNPFDLNKVQVLPENIDDFLEKPVENNSLFNETISDLPEHNPVENISKGNTGSFNEVDDKNEVTLESVKLDDGPLLSRSPLPPSQSPLSPSPLPVSKSPLPSSPSPLPTSQSPLPTSRSPFPTSPMSQSPLPGVESPVPSSPSPVGLQSPIPAAQFELPNSHSPLPGAQSPVPISQSPLLPAQSPLPTSQSPLPTSQSPLLVSQSPVPLSESPLPTIESGQSPFVLAQSPVPQSQSPLPSSQTPILSPSPVPPVQSPVPSHSPLPELESPVEDVTSSVKDSPLLAASPVENKVIEELQEAEHNLLQSEVIATETVVEDTLIPEACSVSTPKSTVSEQVDTESVVTADMNSFLERSLMPDITSPLSGSGDAGHEEAHRLLDAFTSNLETNKVEDFLQNNRDFIPSARPREQDIVQDNSFKCSFPLESPTQTGRVDIEIKSEIIAPEYPVQTLTTPSEESKADDITQNETLAVAGDDVKENVAELVAIAAVTTAVAGTAAAAVAQKKTPISKPKAGTPTTKKPATKPLASPTKTTPTAKLPAKSTTTTRTTVTQKVNQITKSSIPPKQPTAAAKPSPKPRTPVAATTKVPEKKPLTNGDIKPSTLTARKVPLTASKTTTKPVPSKLSPTKTVADGKTSTAARPATAPAKSAAAPAKTTTIRQTRPTTLTARTSTISSTAKTTSSSVTATKSTVKSTTLISPRTTTSAAPKPRPTTAPARPKLLASKPSPKAPDTEKQIKETTNKQITASSRTATTRTNGGSATGRTTTTTVRKTEPKVPGTRTTVMKTTTTTVKAKTDPKKPAELIRHSSSKTKGGVTTKKTKTEQNGIVTEINTITSISSTTIEPQLVKDVSPVIENLVVFDNSQLSESNVTD